MGVKTNKEIVFTRKNHAEFLEGEYKKPSADEVVVETVFSTLSCGTEKANITGNLGCPEPVEFPRKLGYSSAGIVVELGENVTELALGDRVIVYWGTHSKYNTVYKKRAVKIDDDSISFQEAALAFIATFPLAAIRKTHFEIGESAIVMGLGLLGQLAIKLLKAAGAVPLIAVDPVEKRRKEALLSGADYALDPCSEGFSREVKTLTNGGANVAIEVTGVGQGLDNALDCMARFGRVSLLGCTRDKNFTIDYYNKVHVPGITLVGAHTRARPNFESHPGYFTHEDDIRAVLKLCTGKRLDLLEMIKETYSPEICGEVYNRLIKDPEFPTVVQFDWSKV